MNGGQMISNGRAYKITIQKRGEATVDESGFETEEAWEDFYTNYAYVNSLSGNERWAAAQVQDDRTVRFTLRWHKVLDEVRPKYYRIIYAGKAWTITYVDNVQYSNETVKIDALEVES